MAVGENIRLLRKEKNLTQQALADQTGIPVRTIVNYENSSREPNAKNMAILERFFNVSGGFLRGESEIRNLEHALSDSDTVELLRIDLPNELKKLSILLEKGSDAEVETAYHVIHELSQILSISNPTQRSTAFSIFQDIIAASIFFLDICENVAHNAKPAEQIKCAKGVACSQIDAAMEKAQFFLPG